MRNGMPKLFPPNAQARLKCHYCALTDQIQPKLIIGKKIFKKKKNLDSNNPCVSSAGPTAGSSS